MGTGYSEIVKILRGNEAYVLGAFLKRICDDDDDDDDDIWSLSLFLGT